MEGSNDIWDSVDHTDATTPAVTAGQIIDGLRTLTMLPTPAASESSAPLLPFKAITIRADFQRAEAIRQAVNNSILGSGEYDAVATSPPPPPPRRPAAAEPQL